MWFVEVSTSGRFLSAACDGPDFPQIHHLLARGCDLGRDRRAAGSARKSAGERRRGVHSALGGCWNRASKHQPAQMRRAAHITHPQQLPPVKKRKKRFHMKGPFSMTASMGRAGNGAACYNAGTGGCAASQAPLCFSLEHILHSVFTH